MSNQVNLDGILKSDADFLAKEQVIPNNTTAVGNGGGFYVGNTLGGIEVIAQVGSVAAVVANTKVLTLKLQQSSDNGVADAYADLATLYTITASGDQTLAIEAILGKYVLPTNFEGWLRASIVSTETGEVGKVNIYMTYLPR